MRSRVAFAAVGPGWSARFRRQVLALTAATILGAVGAPVLAKPQTQAVDQAHAAGLQQQTLDLARLVARYRQASASEQANLRNQLEGEAKARRRLLSELVQSDPDAVLHGALPAQFHSGLPNDVAALLEQPEAQAGTLQLVYEDYTDGRHKLRHFLNTRAGKRLELHFAGKAPALRSGDRVHASGLRVGDSLALEGSGIQTLALDATTGSVASTGSMPIPPTTFGEQHTLVMLVNFQDAPANQPWTVEQARSLVFGSVSDYFRENSYQQAWLGGDVFGWHTLALDSTSCDINSISQQADAAARNAGVDMSSYQHFVYLFPANSSCGWAGMGTVGGMPSQTWINGKLDLQTIAHELGHNFGLQHSHALECGSASRGSNCENFEYGDRVDIMGNYTAGHLAPFQKQLLGWLAHGASPAITEVTTSGTYTLTPYEVDDGGTKALKIPMGTDPASGQPQWYYLEYRQALGSDSFLAGNSNVLNGVVVRTGTDANPGSSFLLDMTPESASNGYYDWADHALPSGMSYDDANAGVSITTDWTNGNQASVTVSLAALTCQPAQPLLTLTPVASPWAAAGTAVSYSLALTNRDSGSCPGARFDLQAQLPAGWGATFEQTALTLAPGQTASTTLTVTSAPSAADGYVDIPLTVRDNAEPLHDLNASVSYVVSNASTTTGSSDQPDSPQGSTTEATGANTGSSGGGAMGLGWLALLGVGVFARRRN